jgi:hypothetical protein
MAIRKDQENPFAKRLARDWKAGTITDSIDG